jgi:hypothetical protein
VSERIDGRCLCGACTLTAVPGAEAGACHCEMCRQWSGGIFIGVSVGDTLEIAEGSPVKTFKSSDWGQRVFCSECGSNLAWQTADGKMSVMSIQAFADPSQFPLVSEVFYDSKPTNYALAGETHKLTGAEVMAMFAAKEGV